MARSNLRTYAACAVAGALCLVAAAMPVPALASAGSSATDQFDIGLEGGWYQYREPSFAKLEGPSIGIDATYSYRWDKWILSADMLVDFYNQRYSSNGTGTEKDIADYMQDYRALFGRSVRVSKSISVEPYTGIAYRILFDANGTNVSSTGASGYDRRSDYLYIPVGATADFKVGHWLLRPTAEYDFLIQGYQTSYFSDLGFDNNLVNHQHSGYGLRASFMVSPPLDFHNFSIGPYVRYWSIHNSDLQALLFQGTVVGYGQEPANTTLETGIKASIHF